MIDWERLRRAKRSERAALERVGVSELTPSRRDFAAFLGSGRSELSLVGMLRRRDPYSDRAWPNLDVAAVARAFDEADAAAIAVTTEPLFHGGTFEDLEVAASASTAPVLCDDFALHPGHLYRARRHRADAVVVPVAWLEEGELEELVAVADSLHLVTVAAVFSTDELPRALGRDKAVIGVYGRAGDGTLDLALLRRAAAAIPERRSVLLLGDLPTAELWPSLRGLVDAALVGAPVLGEADLPAALSRFSG